MLGIACGLVVLLVAGGFEYYNETHDYPVPATVTTITGTLLGMGSLLLIQWVYSA